MSDPIFQGLMSAGNSLGGALIQKSMLSRQDEQKAELRGLLEAEEPDINAIAGHDPQIANMLSRYREHKENKQRQQQLLDLETVGNIANVGLGLEDPVKIRSYLTAQLNQGGHGEHIQKEIAEALSMDDDEMLNDLRVGAMESKKIMDANTRNFKYMTDGLSEEDTARAKRIELGLEPRSSDSKDERIAKDPTLGGQVANQKASEAGAVETAKLNSQLSIKPKIAEAIKKAETDATAKGETLTAYNRAKAALPGLQEVAGKLKSLADVATYTTTGKLFNATAKELGFSATEGATARTQMRSIIDNQVLPLLRDTFGAQFTEKEGERLANTIMDIDTTPEEKKAALDSFISQKIRDLEVQERELGVEQAAPSKLSIDDLVNKYAN